MLSISMKGIKNNLFKHMTLDQKMHVAWQDMQTAVSQYDLPRIFKLAYWIKSMLAEVKEELPTIKA